MGDLLKILFILYILFLSVRILLDYLIDFFKFSISNTFQNIISIVILLVFIIIFLFFSELKDFLKIMIDLFLSRKKINHMTLEIENQTQKINQLEKKIISKTKEINEILE